MISHNLLTVTDADRIVFLEDGRINAVGAHADLLTRSPGYARLYRLHHPAPTMARAAAGPRSMGRHHRPASGHPAGQGTVDGRRPRPLAPRRTARLVRPGRLTAHRPAPAPARRVRATEGTASRSGPPRPFPAPRSRRTGPPGALGAVSGPSIGRRRSGWGPRSGRRSEGRRIAGAPVRWNRGALARAVGDRRARHRPRRPRRPPARRPHRRRPVHRLRHPGLPRARRRRARTPMTYAEFVSGPARAAPLLGAQPRRLAHAWPAPCPTPGHRALAAARAARACSAGSSRRTSTACTGPPAATRVIDLHGRIADVVCLAAAGSAAARSCSGG